MHMMIQDTRHLPPFDDQSTSAPMISYWKVSISGTMRGLFGCLPVLVLLHFSYARTFNPPFFAPPREVQCGLLAAVPFGDG